METGQPRWRQVTGVVSIIVAGVIALVGWSWFEDVPEAATVVESVRGLAAILLAAALAIVGVVLLSTRSSAERQ